MVRLQDHGHGQRQPDRTGIIDRLGPRTRRRLAITLGALALAVPVLAGCTATAAPTLEAAGPSPTPTASHAPEPSATPASAGTDAEICPHFRAKIYLGTMRADIKGNLVDQGPREFATGSVGLDDEGNIVSYTVAPGDAPNAIGERLCMEYGAGLPMLNHTRTLHPGQVLRLSFDPDIPWVPYIIPRDVPAGFQQSPYQQAIEQMAAAGDVGDVDTMRVIWADTLAGMFTNPEDIATIQAALDAGDPDVLNQMFS